MPDPCLTRTKLTEQSDTTADSLAQLIAAWKEYDALEQGVVVCELVNRLYAKEFAPRDSAAVAMRAALENLVGCPPSKAPSARQIGAKFKFFRRRVVGQCFIDCNANEHNRNDVTMRISKILRFPKALIR